MDETTTPSLQSENAHSVIPPLPHHRLLQHKIVLIIIFFIIGLVAGSYCTRLTARTPETLSVIGTSSHTVHADKATLTATTYETGNTASQAKSNNEKVIADITTKIQQLGLKASDLKIVSTRNTNFYNPGGSTETQVSASSCLGNCGGNSGANASYNASTDIKIEFDQTTIDKANSVSDMLTGLNVYPTLVYNIANKDAVSLQNKQKAIENAKIQADSLAKSTSETINKVLGIKEILPTLDPSSGSLYSDPTVDSATRDIQVTSSFEVTYQISASLFNF